MRQLAALVSFALIGSTAVASTTAEIMRAPERAISPPQITAAANNQFGTRIATSGDVSLAAWTDWRGGNGDVYATRLDASGNPLDPLGIFIAHGGLLATVWNGMDFGVFVAGAQDSVVFVGLDGSVSPPKAVALKHPSRWIAAGPDRLLVATEQFPTASVAVLDGRGELVAPPVLLPGSTDQFGIPELVGVGDSEFLILRSHYEGPGSITALAQRVGFNGRLLSSTSFMLPFQADTRIAVAGGDGTWAIVRQSEGVALYRMNAVGVWDGAVETLQVRAATDTNECCRRPVIARQGDQYVLGWHTSLTTGEALTYGAEVPVHGGAARVKQLGDWVGSISDLALAPRNGGTQVVTAASRNGTSSAIDVLGQRVDANLNGTTPVEIAMTGAVQTNVGAAAGNDGYLLSWTDLGPDANLYLLARRVAPDGTRLDSAPIEIARYPIDAYNKYNPRPRIASNGETYLMSWSVAGTVQGRRMLARTGQWIDRAPFTIGSGDSVAIASNGRDALATWTGTCPAGDSVGCLFARPIPLVGDPFSGSVVTVSGARDNFDPAVASDGTDYFVAFSNGSRIIICPGPAPALYSVLGTRLRADGTKIDADPIVIENKTPSATSSSIVWNGGRYVVAWSTGNELRAARVTREGAVLETDGGNGTVVQKEADNDIVVPLLVSRPDELILLARHVNRSRGDHLSWEAASIAPSSALSDFRALPRTMLLQNENDTNTLTLSAASGATGFMLAYDRLAIEAVGGVARVFFRVLRSTQRRHPTGR